MHNGVGEFHLSTLRRTSHSNVSLGIGVFFAHVESHISLERFTEFIIGIGSGKIPIWWMDPGIPWSDRLSQATMMMDGIQHRPWDLVIDGLRVQLMALVQLFSCWHWREIQP